MCGLIRFRALSDLQFPVPDLRDDQVEARDKVKMNPLPAEREKFLTWSQDAFPEMPEDVRHLLALCKYVCDLNASNYMMSNKQKLVLSMLADGHAWRAHHRQIFHYEDGAWVRTSSLVIEAWDVFLALEGLFIQLALNLETENATPAWSWSAASVYIMDIIQNLTNNVPDVSNELRSIAKQNSDHLRKATGNKTWHAAWSRRVADMLVQIRKSWECEHNIKALSKLFLVEWDSPMPKSNGVCFDDVYVTDQWELQPKGPHRNCYLKLNYDFLYEKAMHKYPNLDIREMKRALRLFIESVYYDNQPAYQIKLCFMHAAFRRVCTSKMLFQIGKGGDGKGMEAILDKALFGELATSTLDCGVFLDRAEFRKSAELAWNRANVRIQEMDHNGRFVADIWKRFVVDEDIDCRVNYGFTAKRRFGECMKIQELNYDNIPIIEEAYDRRKSCQQLQRRVVCVRMGKGVFISDDTAVDHAKGVFRLIPQDELTALLAHPVTAAIYLREYCIPFFQETSLTECLHMIHDLSSVHPDLARDTDWLASRLSGGNAPPPGVEKDLMSTYNELLVATHEATPHRRLIKEYLVHKVEALPGCIGSSKGKRTKLSYLVEAIDNSTFKLFKQVDHGVFSKLLVDWTKLLHIMNNNGGADVFGDWATWCCPFDLLHLQEKWVGDAFTMQRDHMVSHKTVGGDSSNLGRPSVQHVHEKANIDELREYALRGTDRRQPLLEQYIMRHESQGLRDGSFSTIIVDYYQPTNYGRLLARGVAGQKLTREARHAAFGGHCVEVDAPCCHPRLLGMTLLKLGLWDAQKYPMLNKFTENYQAWRQAIADYEDISLADAKVELIKIFYGGKPTREIPFLLKLCDEVQKAAEVLLRHPSSSHVVGLYQDRRNPEFSRLCSLLSFAEAKLLSIATESLGPRVQVLIFDGCYVSSHGLSDDMDVEEACDECSKKLVPMTVKSWPSKFCPETPVHAIVRGGNCDWEHYDTSLEDVPNNCLLQSIAGLESTCDLTGIQPDSDDVTLSAKDFNTHMLYGSQTDASSRWLLRHVQSQGAMPEVMTSGTTWMVHQLLPGDKGHWWGIRCDAMDSFSMVDSTAGRRRLVDLSMSRVRESLFQYNGLTWFQLSLSQSPEDRMEGHVYDLRGAAPTMPRQRDPREILTPVTSCLECGAPLAHAHTVSGRLYGLGGLEEISMVIKRCSKKTCRAHHHYNYRKVEGQKYHSLDLDQMEYIFVNSKVGFSRQFLDYHNALQFRGGLSHNAIMFAQGEAMWEDRDQHARWHMEYANAQLYYQVLKEATQMWTTPSCRKQLFNIRVEQPLENEFLDFYRDWWHRKQFSLADWRAVKEVVIDGHEKVSAKCQGPPPVHVGRPRKDGANKQRHNGWFMAMDPRSGMVMSVADMEEPENNVVAKNVLQKVVTKAVNLNCVIYDKMCVCLKSFATDKDFKQVKYWSIDRFHAKAHSVSCPCSPIHVRRLDLRLRSVNSSIAEQTFSWFRGYASSFNTKAHDTHIFYVLLYVKMHNSLVRQNRLQHLNAFSARSKIAKAARVLRKPASKKYHCRRPASSVNLIKPVHKKPANKVRKNNLKRK